jgi:hypothetical protein
MDRHGKETKLHALRLPKTSVLGKYGASFGPPRQVQKSVALK